MLAKRTTYRITEGTKLYAERKRWITDAQTFKRAHGQDVNSARRPKRKRRPQRTLDDALRAIAAARPAFCRPTVRGGRSVSPHCSSH